MKFMNLLLRSIKTITSLPQNQDGMKYAKGLIKNIINFFDDRIIEYIIDENYNKDLKAWMIPIEAIFFVGDNFQETIESSDDFLQLQKMCENKDLKLSIYPHLPDFSAQKDISPFAPSIYKYSLYFQKINQ